MARAPRRSDDACPFAAAGCAMSVSGYASTSSVSPGASIGFHLSSNPPGAAALTVERVGTTTVSASLAATLSTRTPPAVDAWEGFGWPVDATFAVPAAWPSGLYRLAHGTDPC
jgi:hypothetical protein